MYIPLFISFVTHIYLHIVYNCENKIRRVAGGEKEEGKKRNTKLLSIMLDPNRRSSGNC